jgi:hypothetical protein
MVDRLPFTRVPWVSLEEAYPPFVKNPILKLASVGNPVETPATEAMA